jgi:hypothetical protein
VISGPSPQQEQLTSIGEVLRGRQMSWLPWLGVRCVAVLEWPARGGAGGKDEVRPVHSPPGCAVDEDRFGLGPGLGVHEHHAALMGGEARVAPCGQDDDYGPEGTVDLTDRFALRDGRIASLEIVPATANGNDPVPAYRQLARVLL